MIKLNNGNKSYVMGKNVLHVLKNVSLTVHDGEYVNILGASGSGKTTLMNIIGCMDVLDSGTYTIDDVPVHNCNDNELAKLRNQKIGFVFQKYQLIPQYNVLQNVIMPLLIRGIQRGEAKHMAESSIRMVGLWDRVMHRPNELSGGQQQRVAIARALVTRPAILLADEPTGALDSATGREILSLFQELNEQGNTIIQISHDINVAKASKRILCLTDGVLE